MSQCVSASIGPAGTVHLHRSLHDPSYSARELTLNGVQMRLNLPAVETGAVVGDFET